MRRSGIRRNELARDRLGTSFVYLSPELDGRLIEDEILSVQPDLRLRPLQIHCDPRPASKSVASRIDCQLDGVLGRNDAIRKEEIRRGGEGAQTGKRNEHAPEAGHEDFILAGRRPAPHIKLT